MNEHSELMLNLQQIEYIQSRLPVGYSFLLASLAQPREQRIPKKVSKYDASFQNRGLEVEDISKRPSRQQLPPPVIKEQSESVRKGLSLLTKLRNHTSFPEFNAVCGTEIDRVETQFSNGGSLQMLWNDLRKVFQSAYLQLGRENVHILKLENYFNEIFKQVVPVPKKKIIQTHTQKLNDQPMSYSEKRQLGQNIRDLQTEHLKGVWEIVSQTIKAEGDEELEFDIDKLPTKVTRQLEKYVNSKLSQNKKKIRISDSLPQSEHKNTNQDSSFPSESSD